MAEPFGLTEAARSRLATSVKGRELAAIAIVGIPFLVAAVLLAATSGSGDVDTLDVVLFVVAAAVMGHLEFETGAGSLVPTQLIFVPMLFVLPPAIVPLVVLAGLVLADVPDVVAGRLHPQRLVAVAGNAWFALGPAVLFVVGDISEPGSGRLAAVPARARGAVRRGPGQRDAARAHRPRRRAEASARRRA